jgi:hypothetical protein
LIKTGYTLQWVNTMTRKGWSPHPTSNRPQDASIDSRDLSGAAQERDVTPVRRLVTYADIDDRCYDGTVSVTARHELELTDGRRVLLLDDRGWGSSGSWAEASVDDIQRTTRMVVGPDEPPEGRSQQEMETLHWNSLQQTAHLQGVIVDAAELQRLQHDVVLSERLLARIDADSGTSCG